MKCDIRKHYQKTLDFFGFQVGDINISDNFKKKIEKFR